MQRKHNAELTHLARQLRPNTTEEERRLWYCFLRGHEARFSRQKVLGRYIADFYSAKAKLVIELDGSQHYDEENAAKDKERTAFLEQYGLKVIRIQNNELNGNFRNVCEYIDTTAKQRMTPTNKSSKENPNG